MSIMCPLLHTNTQRQEMTIMIIMTIVIIITTIVFFFSSLASWYWRECHYSIDIQPVTQHFVHPSRKCTSDEVFHQSKAMPFDLQGILNPFTPLGRGEPTAVNTKLLHTCHNVGSTLTPIPHSPSSLSSHLHPLSLSLSLFRSLSPALSRYQVSRF